MDVTALIGICGLFLTGFGLIFLASQVRDSRRFIKAQFISNLQQEIVQLYDTYAKLLPNEPWSSEKAGPANSVELANLTAYLGFFAKINFLLELKALDIKKVDTMFAFRFFLIAHNIHVQEKLLFSDQYKNFWTEIFLLHKDWVSFRLSKNLMIPFKESTLELYDPSYYDSVIRAK